MINSRQRIAGDKPREVGKALDMLVDLIIDVASDERRLSALAARLTDLDMEDLGFPKVGGRHQGSKPVSGISI